MFRELLSRRRCSRSRKVRPEESDPRLPQDRVSASESGRVPLAFEDTLVSLDGLSKLHRQVWVTTALCGEQAVRSPPAGVQADPEEESISSGVQTGVRAAPASEPASELLGSVGPGAFPLYCTARKWARKGG